MKDVYNDGNKTGKERKVEISQILKEQKIKQAMKV
jgi:hypothetical protein